MRNISWGERLTGSVGRQTAHFYRLTVTEEDLKKGVIISCSSDRGDRFKLLFFDGLGDVSMAEESRQNHDGPSEAAVFAVPFERHRMGHQSQVVSHRKRDRDGLPKIFSLFDSFEVDSSSLLPGSHVFCVYGDNWFKETRYSLRCLVAAAYPATSGCVEKIKEAEQELASLKEEVNSFQVPFLWE